MEGKSGRDETMALVRREARLAGPCHKSKRKIPSRPMIRSRLQQMLALRSLTPRSREAYLTYVQKFALHRL